MFALKKIWGKVVEIGFNLMIFSKHRGVKQCFLNMSETSTWRWLLRTPRCTKKVKIAQANTASVTEGVCSYLFRNVFVDHGSFLVSDIHSFMGVSFIDFSGRPLTIDLQHQQKKHLPRILSEWRVTSQPWVVFSTFYSRG